MPRSENPVDPQDGPLAAFAHDLRSLREKAGNPSYRQLARRAGFSPSTLSVAANGRALPSLEVTLAYVQVCGGDPRLWRARWTELADLEPARTPGPVQVGAPKEAPAGPGTDSPAPLRAPRLRRVTRARIAAVLVLGVVVALTATVTTAFVHSSDSRAAASDAAQAGGGSGGLDTTGGPFVYDETTGPGCVIVFTPGRQEQVAQVEADNGVDMARAWVSSTSDEPHWAVPDCTDTMLYSQTSNETNQYQWQNDFVWKFFDVPPNVPCTFHIYIALSPKSKYDATYDWTNGLMVGNWVDANSFTVDQSTYAGSWYTDAAHSYTTGMAFLMLTDQRGTNPPSADAPLTASEVRLTCSR